MFKTNNKNCWEKWIKELRRPVFVAEAKQRYIIHSNELASNTTWANLMLRFI